MILQRWRIISLWYRCYIVFWTTILETNKKTKSGSSFALLLETSKHNKECFLWCSSVLLETSKQQKSGSSFSEEWFWAVLQKLYNHGSFLSVSSETNHSSWKKQRGTAPVVFFCSSSSKQIVFLQEEAISQRYDSSTDSSTDNVVRCYIVVSC